MTPFVATTAGASAAALEDAIAHVAQRCLRASSPIDPDMPFALLGLDSLATIELAAALEDELGCGVPADLLAECPDARTLASRLADLLTHEKQCGAEDPFDRMFADAVLPGDVQPVSGAGGGAVMDVGGARAILLTGATGFLGAALARELLDVSAATLLCLVRPGDNPGERLRRHVAAAGVSGTQFAARVRVVEGDLAQPRLGLADARFEALARSVDAIYHAGAAVNWVFSYAGLRAANVGGTLEILRLACRGRATPFHFISSVSVCYSTTAPPTAGESFDALPYVRGVHLGYAQSKIVAEALVREAGARGLPIRIYRPALISGHSQSGAFNRDDLISALVRGCVHMGTAPDLDWKLDCVPVDVVAKQIVALSANARARGGALDGCPVVHLGHERPRHWRECVLWMRLYGYPIRLVSYHRWLRQLEAETNPSPTAGSTHPLRGLRSFFLDLPTGGGGLTMPELYEEGRRTHATRAVTQAALDAAHVPCPPLDAALLDTYFAAFQTAGDLPSPVVPLGEVQKQRRSAGPSLDAPFFSSLLGLDVVNATVLGSGSDHSIVSELTAWRSSRSCDSRASGSARPGPVGLFRVRLEMNGQGEHSTRDVVVKAKALDRDVIDVGAALAGLIDPAIGRAYGRWSDRVGFTASHTRELAVYSQRDPRFLLHSPAVLGSMADEGSGTWLLVLEDVGDASLFNSADRPEAWTPANIATAIDGLSALQAIWYGREAELSIQPWVGHVQTTGSMTAMADLWIALAEHAASAFSSWADPGIASLHTHLIGRLERWWRPLEDAPRTLIHHDLNPRNICIRGVGSRARLCAYDWELATLGAPQRDLAELLCFVLRPDAGADEARFWIDRHRASLERATGVPIDADRWRQGFSSALCDLMINRLSTYALVHRIRRQSFLPRVVKTWRRLYQHFPLEPDA